MFKLGDRVKMSDADTATTPAYRAMRGVIVEVKSLHCVCVQWLCDGKDAGTDVFTRRADTIVHSDD